MLAFERKSPGQTAPGLKSWVQADIRLLVVSMDPTNEVFGSSNEPRPGPKPCIGPDPLLQ